MRKGILIALTCVFTTLALWSAWNPGWNYLTRFAAFSIIGAGVVYVMARGRSHALTFSLLYLTAVVATLTVVDLASSPPDAVESESTFLLPMALALSVITGFVAVTHVSPGPGQRDKGVETNTDAS
ncbi:MAG TPA: hypothetical protein VFT85_05225 [Acidimicrobiia bacterium]|nr:hypothetical protein [Acidimicrobiia bacterium]